MAEIENEKYKDLSREDLLKIIEKMDSRKKYGLIWDEEKAKEKFEKDSVNALPILKEIKGKEITTSPDEPINILIEGDNYHALSVLNFTHQGKIDVIYIDPPYNTGNKDFKYNDCWIDKEDVYRHSKWLSFMSKRLRLAKNLLKDTGVIFISIDDNEYAQLKMLCDTYIFSERDYVGTITWERKRKGSHLSKKFTKKTEYILIYAFKGEGIELFGSESGKEEDQPLIKRTNAIKKLVVPKDLITTKLDDGIYKKGKYGSGSSSVNLLENINVKNGQFLSDLKLEGPFIWTQENLDEEVSLGATFFIRTINFSLRVLKGEQSQGFKALSSILTKEVGTNEDAKSEIAKILGVSEDSIGIDYPKPASLIMKLLSSYRYTDDFTVLDFFAGSGTTGHALLELNNMQKKKCKFILCTNDEENICTDVCYPRVKNVINGYQSVNGLKGNLKYFRTGFVKKTINGDDMKMKLTRECTEMLCIREGVFDEKKKTDDYAIFEQKGHIMAVYYSIERKGLKELKKELDKTKGEKVLYCFTLDPLGLDKSDFTNWKDTQLEPIPQKILEIYEEIYEY